VGARASEKTRPQVLHRLASNKRKTQTNTVQHAPMTGLLFQNIGSHNNMMSVKVDRVFNQ